MTHVNDLTTPDMDQVHWEVIGVFPTVEQMEGDGGPFDWNCFCYTVGLLPEMELWAPCMSVEGRMAGHELTTSILNLLAWNFLGGKVGWGDDVTIPLGVPGGDDIDTVWWVSNGREPSRKRGVNMSPARYATPIVWTSGLGWDD